MKLLPNSQNRKNRKNDAAIQEKLMVKSKLPFGLSQYRERGGGDESARSYLVVILHEAPDQ